jgi:hypothetical protein
MQESVANAPQGARVGVALGTQAGIDLFGPGIFLDVNISTSGLAFNC